MLRCTVCGAPQVLVSSEVQAEAAAQRQRYEEAAAEGSAPVRAVWSMDWKQAIRLSVAASGAAVALCAFFPPLAVMAWLLPAAVLLVYRMRAPGVLLTPLAGARIGALIGLFCGAVTAVAGTVYLAVRRFGMHRLHGFDALYEGALVAARRQAVAQNGAGAADSFAMLDVPEFRAGMLLVFGLIVSGVFVLLCTLSGALAGALRAGRVPSMSGEDGNATGFR